MEIKSKYIKPKFKKEYNPKVGLLALTTDLTIEKDFNSVQGVSTDNRELEFEIEKMEIADVAESFVKNGLRIYGIEQKRKLEDYFIKMIAEV